LEKGTLMILISGYNDAFRLDGRLNFGGDVIEVEK